MFYSRDYEQYVETLQNKLLELNDELYEVKRNNAKLLKQNKHYKRIISKQKKEARWK